MPGDVLTLRQLRSDPNLLEQLAVDGEPYRLRYEQLKSVAAFVDTSPGYLAPRMRRVESRLTGQQSVVLASDPAELLDQLRTVGELAGAYPWQMPYKALFYSAEADGRRRISEATRRLNPSQVPPAMQQIAYNLGRGRTMYFKGKLTGPESATSYFQAARLSNEQIEAARITEEEKLLAMSIKQDASYWLGLAQYERGAYDTAIDYFLTRSLEAFPGGTWENGARYNLGRAYESIGDLDRAITLYRSGNSPQKHGNLLRARRLQQELEAAKSEETK